MITPSKYIPFEGSIIFKMLPLLDKNNDGLLITELYSKYEHQYEEIDEFLYSLDVLYALELINVDFQKGTIFYA